MRKEAETEYFKRIQREMKACKRRNVSKKIGDALTKMLEDASEEIEELLSDNKDVGENGHR